MYKMFLNIHNYLLILGTNIPDIILASGKRWGTCHMANGKNCPGTSDSKSCAPVFELYFVAGIIAKRQSWNYGFHSIASPWLIWLSSSSNNWQLGYHIKSAMEGTHFDHFLKGPMSHILQTFDSFRRFSPLLQKWTFPVHTQITLSSFCSLLHGHVTLSLQSPEAERNDASLWGHFPANCIVSPVTGMIYDYHDTLMCRIHRGPGNLEIWGWAWNTCKVLAFSHATFPVSLLISPSSL